MVFLNECKVFFRDYMNLFFIVVFPLTMILYGVSMIILVSCAGGIGCFTSFGDERKNKTILRMIASPVKRTNIFMQKVFDMMLSAGVEIGVIMIVGTVFFNVHYAKNIFDNILLFLFFFVSMMTLSCVGVSLGLFMKGNPLLIFGRENGE